MIDALPAPDSRSLMSEETIADAIDETAQAPARVSADGTTVDAQRIDDQIKAANYLAARTAGGRNHLGIRFLKLIPPGGG